MPVLQPLHEAAGLRRLVVSTFHSLGVRILRGDGQRRRSRAARKLGLDGRRHLDAEGNDHRDPRLADMITLADGAGIGLDFADHGEPAADTRPDPLDGYAHRITLDLAPYSSLILSRDPA